MGLLNFFNLFKTSTSKDSVKNVKAKITQLPGTELYYDPELINNLKDDHQKLLKIYNDMGEALSSNNFDQLASLFTDFKTQLQKHILTENLKLNIYLSHAITNDPDSLAIITELRAEMQKIGRAVNKFFNHYAKIPWTEEQILSFPEEFNNTGSILVDRIEREESNLYPLYLHPSSYCRKEI